MIISNHVQLKRPGVQHGSFQFSGQLTPQQKLRNFLLQSQAAYMPDLMRSLSAGYATLGIAVPNEETALDLTQKLIEQFLTHVTNMREAGVTRETFFSNRQGPAETIIDDYLEQTGLGYPECREYFECGLALADHLNRRGNRPLSAELGTFLVLIAFKLSNYQLILQEVASGRLPERETYQHRMAKKLLERRVR